MKADIVRLDVGGRVRSVVGYTLGMALYTFVVVAIYPAFKDSTGLDKLVRDDSTFAALFGVSGSLTSSGGWLNANLYANFLPLMMFLLTIGYGAASLAGQDEEGTLGLLVALPVSRARIVGEKIAAMALQAAVLSAGVFLCVLSGVWFDLSTRLGDVLAISVLVLLLGLDFGLVAMALGALTARRGLAIAVPAALAAASYLVSSLAPVASWIRPGRYFSLFYWAVGRDQITVGATGAEFAVLGVVGALAAWASFAAFARMDVR